MRQPTEYEESVNKFIPAAIEHANERTMRKYPKYGPRVCGTSKASGIRLADLPEGEREIYEEIFAIWNRTFHLRMCQLTREEGVRLI